METRIPPHPIAMLANTAALMIYVASALAYLGMAWRRQPRWGKLGSFLLAFGAVVNIAALFERSRVTHSVPYTSIDGALSLAALYLAVLTLWLEGRHEQRTMSLLLLPLIVTAQASASLMSPAAGTLLDEARRGPLFAIHVNASMFATVAFTLSFLASALYLVQHQILKSRRPGPLFHRLPSLALLEGINTTAIVAGLVSMGIGFVTGALWGARVWSEKGIDGKVWWSLLTLLLYGSYLFLKRRRGWRGPRSKWVSLAAYAMVLLGLTVVNLYVSAHHGYG